MKCSLVPLGCVLLSLSLSCGEVSETTNPGGENAKPALEPTTQTSEGDAAAVNDSGETMFSRGELAGLSKKQVEELIDTPEKTPNFGTQAMPVMVPSYIPEGFEVYEFRLSTPFAKDYQELYIFYEIGYKNEQGHCFFISSTGWDEELGDDPFEFEERFSIDIVALNIEVDLGYTSFDQVFGMPFMAALFGPQSTAENPHGSFAFNSPSGETCNTPIDPSEAIRIIESLQYLDPEETQKLEVFSHMIGLEGEF